MRVKNMVNKRECLECLFREINILTECRHPNIVKILDASFDGMIIKEQRVGSETDRDQDMFGQQQQTSKGSYNQAQSSGNPHGEDVHSDKIKDGNELSIIEQVDNGSSVGVYYDEVDDMLAHQFHHQSDEVGENGAKKLGSTSKVNSYNLT